MKQYLLDKRHWCQIVTLALACVQLCTPVFKDYPNITAGMVGTASLLYLIGHWLDKS